MGGEAKADVIGELVVTQEQSDLGVWRAVDVVGICYHPFGEYGLIAHPVCDLGDFVAVDQLGVLKGRRPEGEDVPDQLPVHLDLLDVLLGIVVEAGQAVIVGLIQHLHHSSLDQVDKGV